MLYDWYEPGFKAGGPIRSVSNLAKALVDEYDVYVMAGDRDLRDKEPYPNIQANKWIKRNEVNVYYLPPKRQKVGILTEIINTLAPDTVYLNSMFSVPFTITPLILAKQKKINAKIVLTPRGALQKGAIKYKTIRKKVYLFALRQFGVTKKVTIQATDKQEHTDILKYLKSDIKVAIIPNLSSELPPARPILNKEVGHLKIIFASRLARNKNLSFALEVLKKVTGNVVFEVCGEFEREDYKKECHKLVEDLPENIKVVFLGTIPNKKVKEQLAKNHLFILPSEGENFGHAILEALSASVPVLISDRTPWQDIEEHNAGWGVSLDDKERFISLLEEVVNYDQESYNRLSFDVYQYALKKTENKASIVEYKKMFFTNEG